MVQSEHGTSCRSIHETVYGPQFKTQERNNVGNTKAKDMKVSEEFLDTV